MNRRVLLAAPLGVALLGGGAFYAMLRGLQSGSFDPRGVPSQLIDKPLPDFVLPGFSRADVLTTKKPLVINFFASWCVPCLDEAATLMALHNRRVPVWGIAYKDKPAQTDQFLTRHGNPYARMARDEAGTVAIDWGVTGVPETYVVDANGIVRWRFVGALPDAALDGLSRMVGA